MVDTSVDVKLFLFTRQLNRFTVTCSFN